MARTDVSVSGLQCPDLTFAYPVLTHAHPGLKSGSRLKKETLLFYSTSPVPRASALCSPPPSKLKTEDVMEVEQDSAKPPPQHSPQNNMIREKDAKKDAQVPAATK